MTICLGNGLHEKYYNLEFPTDDIRVNELLHYFLYMSDMKYSDDDAVFHYLCGIYDAHAYKDMGEEEQGLYDKLVNVIPELEKKCKELNCKDGAFSANRDVILMAAWNDRENFTNKELFDYGIKILNMKVGKKEWFEKKSAFECGMSKAQEW